MGLSFDHDGVLTRYFRIKASFIKHSLTTENDNGIQICDFYGPTYPLFTPDTSRNFSLYRDQGIPKTLCDWMLRRHFGF
jgi:hypothetical protein